MKLENNLYDKAFSFSIMVIKEYKAIVKNKKEYILSKQFLRSGTSIGANIAEANGAISKADFSSKISIAYKESLETKYWILLMKETALIPGERSEQLWATADELSKIMFAILKTTRINKP
ncbi:MAG: four helix bundle protein [Flavobacteriales bacterium]|nr:four helix bundle protein [Bacteroidales bacterium AH-315-I05]PCJ87078.1 MAG: four helix bundle protein [Flavobacteriales bacterium]